MTRILIDDGFNLRQLERRLQRAGLTPDSLDAVFVTHEHSDHVGGVAALARRYSIDIYCTEGTSAAGGLAEQRIPWRSIQAGDVLEVGLLGISPFAVPHDAQEPVQYVFTDGSRRAGLLTDVGECSDSIIDALSGLHALILECNHDADLLRNGSYPAFLKQRIAGPHGHLSNEQAAGILDRARSATLAWVAAAHLSRSNNRPELAQQALAQVLGCVAREISVLDQEEGLPWREV